MPRDGFSLSKTALRSRLDLIPIPGPELGAWWSLGCSGHVTSPLMGNPHHMKKAGKRRLGQTEKRNLLQKS